MASFIAHEDQEDQRTFPGHGQSRELDDDELLKWLGSHPDVRVVGQDDRPVGRLLGRLKAGGIEISVTPWMELKLEAGDECLVLRRDEQHICGRLVTPTS